MATTTKKFSAAAVGGAAAIIMVWAFNAATGIDVPAEVGAAVGVILTFITSILIPDDMEEG
jgi:hypothetical protein